MWKSAVSALYAMVKVSSTFENSQWHAIYNLFRWIGWILLLRYIGHCSWFSTSNNFGRKQCSCRACLQQHDASCSTKLHHCWFISKRFGKVITPNLWISWISLTPLFFAGYLSFRWCLLSKSDGISSRKSSRCIGSMRKLSNLCLVAHKSKN